MLQPTDLTRLSNEELRTVLAKQLTLTAAALMEAALIWTELQRRGVDMTALRSGLASYLPRIARRELAAEAVVTFAGRRALLQSLSGMSLDEQRRYAAGETVNVVECDDNGALVTSQRQLNELSQREIVLVIANGRVRTPAEQRQSIAHMNQRPSTRRRRFGSITSIKAQNGLLHVGRSRLEPLDLAPALRALGYDLVRIDP